MTPEASDRTRRLIGDDGLAALSRAAVLVCGLGGVGSWCAEALARAGVGRFGLLDCDSYVQSNLNRQLGALHSTLGRRKTDVEAERLLDINPEAQIERLCLRYGPDTAAQIDLRRWTCVVDAIDQVSAKVLLVRNARAVGTPVFAAMGGGNKLDPTRFDIRDLRDTTRCPLAKAMRKKLRRVGIESLVVVASDEPPRTPAGFDPSLRVQTAGTMPDVVGMEGLLLAHAVLEFLLDPARAMGPGA